MSKKQLEIFSFIKLNIKDLDEACIFVYIQGSSVRKDCVYPYAWSPCPSHNLDRTDNDFPVWAVDSLEWSSSYSVPSGSEIEPHHCRALTLSSLKFLLTKNDMQKVIIPCKVMYILTVKPCCPQTQWVVFLCVCVFFKETWMKNIPEQSTSPLFFKIRQVTVAVPWIERFCNWLVGDTSKCKSVLAGSET